MALDTHGRWPLVGAAAVIPLTAMSARRPSLRPLAALLWHQTEEWVWPGSFLPWMNRELLGSGEDEFPLDRRIAFVINVGFGWGLSAAAATGPAAAVPAGALYVSHLGNAGMHLSWAARHRRYDPGSITSLLTLIPVAVSELGRLGRDPEVSARELGTGVAAGIAISALPFPLMKWRLRRARRRPQASAFSNQ